MRGPVVRQRFFVLIPRRARAEVMLVLTLREAKSRLPIFLICHPIQNHILLVGANGCSPEEVNGELHLTAFNVQNFLSSRF